MKFEPSFLGWTGKLADEATFQSIQSLALRLVPFYKDRAVSGQKLIVGYDSRFMSKIFAEHVATIMANSGIKVFFSTQVSPSPVLAVNSIYKKCLGFVTLTSDMLNSDYTGLRAFTMEGHLIQESDLVFEPARLKASALEQKNFQHWTKRGYIEEFDPSICYENFIDAHIDIPAITPSSEKILFNPCYGSTRLYFEYLLNIRKNNGHYSMNYAPISEIHTFPANPRLHTNDLIDGMLSKNCKNGFSLSPDGTNFEFLNNLNVLETSDLLRCLATHLFTNKLSSIIPAASEGTPVRPCIILSESLECSTEEVAELGFDVLSVSNETFHQTLRQTSYALAIDEFEQFYFTHHNVPDGLLAGYLLFEYFNLMKTEQTDQSFSHTSFFAD